MSKTNYSKELNLNATPDTVFKAITTEIDKWWTIHSNKAVALNEKLTVRFGETTIKEMKITELSKNKNLTWKVTKAYIDIKELSKKDEWVGTEIKWEITPTKNGSKIYFEHKGLIPEFECYNACEGGWNFFIESLKNYLEKGKGSPHGIE
ncbi:SRPBCC domain-containing protein [Tenacibaculum dicentrarchi]|nr:SRPBCC domain-containing protein [Tenacibaculum dicentrarchi]